MWSSSIKKNKKNSGINSKEIKKTLFIVEVTNGLILIQYVTVNISFISEFSNI